MWGVDMVVDFAAQTRVKLKREKLLRAIMADEKGLLKVIRTRSEQHHIERIVVMNEETKEVYFGEYRGVSGQKFSSVLVIDLNERLKAYARQMQMMMLDEQDVRKWIDGVDKGEEGADETEP